MRTSPADFAAFLDWEGVENCWDPRTGGDWYFQAVSFNMTVDDMIADIHIESGTRFAFADFDGRTNVLTFYSSEDAAATPALVCSYENGILCVLFQKA